MSNSSPTFLVTGAAGHLGHRVAELLLERGIGTVIAGSRDPSRLSDLAAAGAVLRKVDFEDPNLAEAFAGVDRLLIVSTDAITEPGRRLRQHKAAVAAAKAAGVRHVTYTSMPRPEPASPIPFAPDHHGTEQALVESGLSHAVLRNSWYAENLLASLPKVLASGKWFSAAGEGRVSHVTREGCAQAAAAVLVDPPPEDACYTITGPQALTTAEIASIASAELGRPITVVPVSDEELATGLTAAGVPASYVPLLVAFDVNTRQGRVDIVTDAVKMLTGREPVALRDFFAVNRGAFLATA